MITTTALADKILKNAQEWSTSSSEAARQQAIASASKLISSLETPAEVLARIGWGEPSRTAALKAAFELDILSKLHSSPQTSAQLADGTPADPQLVARILKHLSAYSLVCETSSDHYTATPFTIAATSDLTLKGGLIYSFEGMIPAFHSLPDFLRETNYHVPRDMSKGPVQHALNTTKPFFAILQEDARLGKAFNDFMTGYGKAQQSWVTYYPTSRLLDNTNTDTSTPLLVDVGGGLGRDITAFHAKHPNNKGALILQDTPTVLSQTSTHLAPAITPQPHDFFTPQPRETRSANAYYLHLVLHDWGDASCRTILAHLRDAMHPHYSRILINENVLRDSGAPWQQTSLDWTMMAMLVNRERTEAQWRELVGSVGGLKVAGIWGSGGGMGESVIEVMLDDE